MRKLILLLLICLLPSGLPRNAFASSTIHVDEDMPAEEKTIEKERLDPKIEAMLEWAVEIAEDDSHGYSQSQRFGPNYDCTSFVSTALMEGGFRLDHYLSTYTLITELPDYGFKVYCRGETEPQRGDILVRRGKHVEICMGDGGCVAAHRDYGRSSGDSNGHEIEYRTGDNEWGCPFCEEAQYDRILRYEPAPPVPVIPEDMCCVSVPN